MEIADAFPNTDNDSLDSGLLMPIEDDDTNQSFYHQNVGRTVTLRPRFQYLEFALSRDANEADAPPLGEMFLPLLDEEASLTTSFQDDGISSLQDNESINAMMEEVSHEDDDDDCEEDNYYDDDGYEAEGERESWDDVQVASVTNEAETVRTTATVASTSTTNTDPVQDQDQYMPYDADENTHMDYHPVVSKAQSSNTGDNNLYARPMPLMARRRSLGAHAA
jgi:hypothetical protein